MALADIAMGKQVTAQPGGQQFLSAIEPELMKHIKSSKELDKVVQVFEMMQSSPEKYNEILQELMKSGAVEAGELPNRYEPTLIDPIVDALHQIQSKYSAQESGGKQFTGNLTQAKEALAAKGRNGDTILAHINPQEAAMLKAAGGSGTINPETGLPEYGFLSSIVSGITGAVKSVAKAAAPLLPVVAAVTLGPAAGAALGLSATTGAAVAGAAAGGLTSAATGGNVLQGALTGGLTGGLTGVATGALGVSNAVSGIQAAVPGISTAEATALANLGYTGSQLAGVSLAEASAAGAAAIANGVSGSVLGGVASNIGSVLGPNTSNILGSLGSAAASVYGGQQAANAAQQAANTYAAAGNQALAEQARQFGIAQANQAPWLTAGQQGLNQQLDLMGLGPQGQAGINQALINTPGYQWELTQGQKALNAGLAARGGMGSGKAATEAIKWGQGLASQGYGNALQRAANLSGVGQNTAVGMANQGANYANQVGNIGLGVAGQQATAQLAGGAAQQQGTLGAANALAGLLGGNTTSTLR